MFPGPPVQGDSKVRQVMQGGVHSDRLGRVGRTRGRGNIVIGNLGEEGQLAGGNAGVRSIAHGKIVLMGRRGKYGLNMKVLTDADDYNARP